MKMKKITLGVFLAALMAAQAARSSSEDLAAAAKAIQLEDVRAKMFFLGGEEMAGRLISKRLAIWLTAWLPSRRRSRMARRVGSATA